MTSTAAAATSADVRRQQARTTQTGGLAAAQQQTTTPAAPTAHVVAPTRTAVSAATQQASRRGAAAAESTARAQVMARSSSAKPTLREGSHGAAVKTLQRQLNHHGAHLSIDGSFGPKTQAAVKAFQERHHLVKDGVVGPITHHALDASHSTTDAAPIHHAPGTSLNTVAGCANFLLHSKNVTFWTGLSSGSERANFERLARGEKAHVFASNRTGPANVTPSLHMMQALVDMAKHGSIQINALTGGSHTFNSNHYSGHAVDLSVVGATQHDHLASNHAAFLSASRISQIANQHGGHRNSETSHIHLDF